MSPYLGQRWSRLNAAGCCPQVFSDLRELKAPECGLLWEQGNRALTSCYREQMQSAKHREGGERLCMVVIWHIPVFMLVRNKSKCLVFKEY